MPSDLVPSPFFICFCTVLPLCNCSLQLINFQGEQKLKWLHLAWTQRWFFSNWLLLTIFYHFNHIKILSPFGLSWFIWLLNACAFPFLTGTSFLVMLIATKIKTDYGWKGKMVWWLLLLPLCRPGWRRFGLGTWSCFSSPHTDILQKAMCLFKQILHKKTEDPFSGAIFSNISEAAWPGVTQRQKQAQP